MDGKELKYSINIIDHDTAEVVWEDGKRQSIALCVKDYELLENGADPVAEHWEDGINQTVCYENASYPEHVQVEMTVEIYDTLRAYMFGDRALSDWTEEQLADRQYFLDWIFDECDWELDLPDCTREDVERLANTVYDAEMKRYREVE